MQIQEFDEALTLVKQAISDEPNFVGGYQLLGDLFTILHRDDEAQRAYRQAEMILQRYAGNTKNSE
jgi:Tfp pilus assembly protein PilF